MNLPASTLLAVWEAGASHAPAVRPAALLAALCGQPAEAVARWPLGRRDGQLLEAWRALHGSELNALAGCPACREPVELEFAVEDVLQPGADHSAPVTLDRDGWSLTWRCPDTLDLAAAAEAQDAASARDILRSRCLSCTGGNSEPPPDAEAALMELAAAADPQADVQLALECPSCRHAWRAAFDIGSFLWAQVQSAARLLLGEVREIAAAFSWSESDILALPPARRAAYLELIRASP